MILKHDEGYSTSWRQEKSVYLNVIAFSVNLFVYVIFKVGSRVLLFQVALVLRALF